MRASAAATTWHAEDERKEQQDHQEQKEQRGSAPLHGSAGSRTGEVKESKESKESKASEGNGNVAGGGVSAKSLSLAALRRHCSSIGGWAHAVRLKSAGTGLIDLSNPMGAHGRTSAAEQWQAQQVFVSVLRRASSTGPAAAAAIASI